MKRKLQRWKNGLDAKGLRVNVGNTKVMKCGVGLQKEVDSEKYNLVGCVVWVLRPTLYSMKSWAHKRYSGFSRKLRAKDAEAFKCKTCVKGANGLNKSEVGCVELEGGSKFEPVDKFCYLGDMLCPGGEQRKLLELEYCQLGESLIS